LDASFKVFRANFKANCLAIWVIAVPFAIVEAIISYSTALNRTVTTSPFGTTNSISSDQIWTYAAGALSVFALGIILSSWASATCVQIIGGEFIGEPIAWRTALTRSFRRLGSIAWILLLTELIWAVPLGLIFAIGIFLLAASKVVGIVVLTIATAAAVPCGVWFYVSQSLSIPVLMLENIRGTKAIRRSIRLIKGSWWSVFGTLTLSSLIVAIAGFAVGVIFVISQLAAHGSAVSTVSISAIQRVISLVLFTPFSATVIVILAIDMRVRKEGFDLEMLAREIEDTASEPDLRGSATNAVSSFPTIARSPGTGSSDSEPVNPPSSEG
jgi:hypothetical protein